MTLHVLIETHLADWNSGWSMGAFGAIAEFHQDAGEPPYESDGSKLQRATARGAISFDAATLDRVRPVAYETLSPRPHRWSHAVALCLPATEAASARRAVLTELGPDVEAIRPEDRDAVLFDMGLSLAQCDFCIRTDDRELLAVLRRNAGRSLFEPDNPTMPAVLSAHPHRVALTALGRVEVFQKIGGPDTGGVSPPGPHTHILPKLLRAGRIHSANTPIPEGLVPLGYLHPGNPVIGPMGEDREFEPRLHAAFQDLLLRYGVEEAVLAKRRIAEAISEDLAPAAFAMPSSRIGRAAARLALRQETRMAEARDDGAMSARVARWRAFVEPQGEQTDEEDDAPGH